MSDDAIKDLRSDLRRSADQQALLKHSEREAFWDRVTCSFKSDWDRVKASGGQDVLDLAVDDLCRKARTRKLFRLSQKAVSGIAANAEDLSRDAASLGREIGLAVAALSVAEDYKIPAIANEMLDAATEVSQGLERLLQAIALLEDVLPTQSGGPQVLSEKVSGNAGSFFMDFAEAAREVWRSAGLSIGGNAVADDGYSEFLDQVHMELFNREIPGRGALLADLRNTWPKPRF